MPFASFFYNALDASKNALKTAAKATGKAITATGKAAGKAVAVPFYTASGFKALKARGLKMPTDKAIIGGGIALELSALGTTMVAANLPRLVGTPLTVAFAAATAFAGLTLPFSAQTAYIIGKDDHEKKKAAKAAKKNAPAPAAN